MVTNLFGVDQSDPKEGKHHPKIIHNPKRFVAPTEHSHHPQNRSSQVRTDQVKSELVRKR